MINIKAINLICVLGTNNFRMKIALKERYVSKKKMRKLLIQQDSYLNELQNIINNV